MTPTRSADGATPLSRGLCAAADFARRLWDKSAETDVLFLAGGVAFNILLAGVPFFLLLASGAGYALGKTAAASNADVTEFVRNLFPDAASGRGSVFDPVVRDIVRTRGTAGLLGAVTFVWFSARLFGSLRAVFNKVFSVPKAHHILVGKAHDLALTLATTILVVVWIASSAYVALARSRGVAFLAGMGLHSDTVMGPITAFTGRTLNIVLLLGVFFSLYKLLPNRKVRRGQALFGAVVSVVLFEAARLAFSWVVHRYNPASLYTGTLAAIVVVVFWVYYAALIVILGGEASQVREDRLNVRHSP